MNIWRLAGDMSHLLSIMVSLEPPRSLQPGRRPRAARVCLIGDAGGAATAARGGACSVWQSLPDVWWTAPAVRAVLDSPRLARRCCCSRFTRQSLALVRAAHCWHAGSRCRPPVWALHGRRRPLESPPSPLPGAATPSPRATPHASPSCRRVAADAGAVRPGFPHQIPGPVLLVHLAVRRPRGAPARAAGAHARSSLLARRAATTR